jgi:hypothetical protein
MLGVATDFGIGTSHLTVPYQAAFNVPGDIEVVARVREDAWTQTYQTFIGRFLSTCNCFILRKSSNVQAGRIEFWCMGAARLSAPFPYTNGESFWIKVTRSATTGDINYYHAADQPTEPTVWTTANPSGAPGTSPVGPLVYTGNPPIQIGADRNGSSDTLDGRVYRAIVRNGIGGPAVFEFNETDIPNNTVTEFTATTGQTVYVVGTPFGNNIPSELLWRFDAKDYPGTGLSYTDPRGRTWTLTAAGAIVPT